MANDIKIIDEKLATIITKKQEKHEFYHLDKFVNMNIFQGKKTILTKEE